MASGYYSDGKSLQPHMLSSGERDIYFFFSVIHQALDRPSIFIIDEPEISLNIKWQRRPISALLECADDNPVQYLSQLSFELLSPNFQTMSSNLGGGLNCSWI